MELLVLNKDLESVAIIDDFESAIWTGRYQEYGDFEIYAQANEELLAILQPDYYIWKKDSPYIMIMEACKTDYDADTGTHFVFAGRSLESILDRRIIWGETGTTGSLQNGIRAMLLMNVIEPVDNDRCIKNLVFEYSDDPLVTSLTLEGQYLGENLYDVISTACKANDIGFQITLREDNKFVFQLYAGADRSYRQTRNPYVVFSQKFENLISSDYEASKAPFKNVTLVTGEEGPSQKRVTVGGGIGLERRELYTDAKDLTQTVDNVLMPEPEYLALLAQRGSDKLHETVFTRKFSGEVDSTRMFKYGKDFFMGDIVQIVSEYGIKALARVTEVVQSQNTTGVSSYPTFTILE